MTRRAAGRMQLVGAGMLVFAAVVAGPALSAAQSTDPAPAQDQPPLTTPDDFQDAPQPPADPATDPADSGLDAEQVGVQATQVTPAPDVQPRAADDTAKAAGSKTVSIGDNFYTPATITITAGDTITWKNTGNTIHSATADDSSFDTGTFSGGQSRSETFSTEGTIPYYCTVHGQAQSGTIKVLAASSGGGGGGDGGGGSGGTGATTAAGSESAAVSSPGAAGSSSSLPSTGFAALGLAAIGMALLASGTILKRVEALPEGGPSRLRRPRLHSIY